MDVLGIIVRGVIRVQCQPSYVVELSI